MDWRDDGIVLTVRPHGETALITGLLTREHGRHLGIIHGQRRRAGLPPGTLVAAQWRGRLADHLGTFTLEVDRTPAAAIMDEPLRLLALVSACAVLDTALAERQPLPGVFDGTLAFLETLPTPHWDAAYVQWEIGLLGALGFGLDVSRCAVTGDNDHLAFISPRTGRAVSLSAAAPYRDRLLPLPGFLTGREPATPKSVVEGLALAGHFVERHLFAQAGKPQPEARTRFVEAYRRTALRSAAAIG
ncbi:DNA repair protein RecO (recombination protein O) [Inquilinus ginsengisoli]|uniref:DNA repair protein RecO n=1 Tax=Inquilinus ginsengisoli TaxID=363840 RepID=A0ABU1JRI5_9PROT|nr:DNA repair protein RecO [Inquilinus ginsengisoli]MDR6291212.1 DNA repair protein RecO (recombination protein O) [Inquilinus ginsengisoli]